MTHKITEEKNSKLAVYMRPRHAFVIFRYENTMEMAVKNVESLKFIPNDVDVDAGEDGSPIHMPLERAPNPSNINWGNYPRRTRCHRYMRNLFVYSLMFCFISVFLLQALQFNKLVAMIRYVIRPPGLDCAQVLKTSEMLEEKAFIEWLEYEPVRSSTMDEILLMDIG